MAKPKQNVTRISPQAEPPRRGIGARIVDACAHAVAFFRETLHEMGRIRWPNRREVVNYTTAALLTCLVMGLLVWGFDVVVSKAMSLIGLV